MRFWCNIKASNYCEQRITRETSEYGMLLYEMVIVAGQSRHCETFSHDLQEKPLHQQLLERGHHRSAVQNPHAQQLEAKQG
jgi:hypothetical protein